MILSTQLSYFYSGLSDNQMDDVFDELKKYQDASQIYDDWIHTLPSECEVHSSVKNYSGINLLDSNQKLIMLFPLLRYHIVVINFWLNQFVYPKEAKQFSCKLATSAWDLCEKKRYPTTGFSGTNDSILLLPLNAVYKEIPELKGTNGGLIHSLLLPENNNYIVLPVNASGKEVLKIISESKKFIRLLLDVGALMLDLSNENVIKEWLKLVSKEHQIEAGIYFDYDDNLTVIDRHNQITKLNSSPYHNRLDKCIIYLDDVHTRGIDLKFPHDTIGAVTLGKNVTKDRLVQGCMRMRLLGHGHVVHFYASSEVHDKIIQITDNNNNDNCPIVLQIIKWVIKNSRDQLVDNFIYWVHQGLSYASRKSIFETYSEKLNGEISNDFIEYSRKCIEAECIELDKLYNDNRVEIGLNKIVSSRIDAYRNHLFKMNTLDEYYKNIAKEIFDKCEKYVHMEKRFSHLLEEEREQELEIEQEDIREQYRPNPAIPLTNKLDKAVQDLVIANKFIKESPSFLPIMESLTNSSLRLILQKNAWSRNLFVTRDFCQTVESQNEIDDYLRPPKWLCIFDSNIIILSDYEANELYPYFKKSQTKLFMFMPRVGLEQNVVFPLSEIKILPYLMTQLFIFGGSIYFKSLEEQQYYASFISYSLSPRTGKEQNYYNDGFIHKNGYVPLQTRQKVFKRQFMSEFNEDPRDLILKLVQIRNYNIVPQSAHHLDIFQSAKKPFKTI